MDLKKLKERGECENWVVEKESEMGYKGFRKATFKTEFAFPKGGQKSEAWADEWVRLRSGERWCDASVGYLADTWYVHSFPSHVSTSHPITNNTLHRPELDAINASTGQCQ